MILTKCLFALTYVFLPVNAARTHVTLEEIDLLEEAGNESAAGAEVRIRALFQNPHWECFARDASGKCERGHRQLFNGWIKKYDIDFAGLAMGGKWDPPSGFGHVHHRSGPEDHDLAWRKSRWTMEKHVLTEFRGGRAAILARFRSLQNPKVKVVVASMHYPHDKTGVRRIGSQLGELSKDHTNHVLFMADTNVGAAQTNDNLMHEFGVKGEVRHTPYRKTCCADTGATFAFEFDRIWTNFGNRFRHIDDTDYMSMTDNLKHAPAFVKEAKNTRGGVAAWHHPVMAELFIGSSTGTGTPVVKASSSQHSSSHKSSGHKSSSHKSSSHKSSSHESSSHKSSNPQPSVHKNTQKCGGLSDKLNYPCKDSVMWAYNKGKYQKTGEATYGQVEKIAGKSYLHAVPHDFQRTAYCGQGHMAKCALPPCDCSNPPCDQC